MTVPRMLTLREASEKSGLSYYCMRNLCLTGKVKHIRSGSKILVNETSLCKFLNSEEDEESEGNRRYEA